MSTAIPFLRLDHMHSQIRGEIMLAFEKVYDANWFLLGQQLSQFEAAYASFNNVRHCLGVSNGLDALRIALTTLNIGPGDEVVLPANTFIATAICVSRRSSLREWGWPFTCCARGNQAPKPSSRVVGPSLRNMIARFCEGREVPVKKCRRYENVNMKEMHTTNRERSRSAGRQRSPWVWI